MSTKNNSPTPPTDPDTANPEDDAGNADTPSETESDAGQQPQWTYQQLHPDQADADDQPRAEPPRAPLTEDEEQRQIIAQERRRILLEAKADLDRKIKEQEEAKLKPDAPKVHDPIGAWEKGRAAAKAETDRKARIEEAKRRILAGWGPAIDITAEHQKKYGTLPIAATGFRFIPLHGAAADD